MRKLPQRWLVVLALCGGLCAGCGGDTSGRVGISGTVSYQSKPLEEGSIQFLSAEKTGMISGAPIQEGKFTIPREHGLTPGHYRVLISAAAGGPQVAPGEAPGPSGPVAKELLPAKYNSQSTLTIEVKPDKNPPFDFLLD